MNEGYRNLMLGVMSTQISDYLNGILYRKLAGNLSGIAKEVKMEDLSRHGRKALEWIKDSESVYIFSFISICKHIDVDPTKMRKRIFAIKTPDQARAVLSHKQKMKSFGERDIYHRNRRKP